MASLTFETIGIESRLDSRGWNESFGWAFGWNFRPMVQDAKRLMDDRGIGEVEQLVVHMSSHTRELLSNRGAYPLAAADAIPEQATWTDPRLSGGGYGQAQLSHALG